MKKRTLFQIEASLIDLVVSQEFASKLHPDEYRFAYDALLTEREEAALHKRTRRRSVKTTDMQNFIATGILPQKVPQLGRQTNMIDAIQILSTGI